MGTFIPRVHGGFRVLCPPPPRFRRRMIHVSVYFTFSFRACIKMVRFPMFVSRMFSLHTTDLVHVFTLCTALISIPRVSIRALPAFHVWMAPSLVPMCATRLHACERKNPHLGSDVTRVPAGWDSVLRDIVPRVGPCPPQAAVLRRAEP